MERAWYVKIRHGDDTYYVYTHREETGADLKRKLSRYTGLKVNEMRLVIPRCLNRAINNEQTLRQVMVECGETLLVLFRSRETGIFERAELGELAD